MYQNNNIESETLKQIVTSSNIIAQHDVESDLYHDAKFISIILNTRI